MGQSKVLLVLAYGLLLVSCQSTPKEAPVAESPATPAPEVVATPEPTPAPDPIAAPDPIPDRIEVSRDGFSPLAAPPNHTLTVSLRWSDPSRLIEWAVLFVPDGMDPVRTIRGTDAIPFVDWDGKTDAGVLAPHGQYRAILQTMGAGGLLTETARTELFLLDIVPPSGTIHVSPLPFVLGPADAIVDPPSMVTIELTVVSGDAPWTTWRLAVLHPDGRRFRDFISENHRDDRIVWDGRAINNAQLEANVTYRLEVEIYDVYGNRGLFQTKLPVEARPTPPKPVVAPVVVAPQPEPAPIPVVETVPTPLPEPEPAPVPAPPAPTPLPAPVPAATTVILLLDGRLLAELPVFFPPYSSDLGAVTGTRKDSNDGALARLAELLLAAQETAVRIVGHANQVLYYDAAKAAYEQTETLIPLSLARAEAVKRALTTSGVSAYLLETVGVGAAEPLASFADATNRWKNRRVVLELR